MTEASGARVLSSGFGRARKLSRVMAVLFTIAFWATLLALCLVPVMVAVPGAHGSIDLGDAVVAFGQLSLWQRVGAGCALAINAIPFLFLMHHARRLFARFACGEVFAVRAIAHIRSAGLWLMVSFFAGILSHLVFGVIGVAQSGKDGAGLWPLVIGIVTTIAAYVMEEARRIAAENAEIV